MMFEELSWGGFSFGKVQVFVREGYQTPWLSLLREVYKYHKTLTFH